MMCKANYRQSWERTPAAELGPVAVLARRTVVQGGNYVQEVRHENQTYLSGMSFH